MASYSKKERANYNQDREKVSAHLGIDKNAYNRLRRLSTTLHKSSEDSAMGTKDWRGAASRNPKEYTEKEHTKDVGHAFKSAKAKALQQKVKGLHFYHQRDPRGTALYAGKERMNDTNYSSKGKPIY